MNCDPQSLLEAARCFSCIPAGMLASVGTNLFCQLTNQPITPVKPFVPTDIPCLEAWYRLEDIDNGIYNDGDPIAFWPPYVGVQNLQPYDPGGTGMVPLFEAAPAGPGPTMGDANLANGSAFSYNAPPYPLEVFLVGFTQLAAMGLVQATIPDSSGINMFRSYIDPGPRWVDMDLGVASTSNINIFPFGGKWTTYDFCMTGANSHVEVGATVGALVPANPGPNVPGAQLILGNHVNFNPLDIADFQWGGSLAEILIFNCVLTNQQRQDLRSYFKTKYPAIT